MSTLETKSMNFDSDRPALRLASRRARGVRAILLALCVFFGMSLATYHRADSLDALVYPAPEKISNACGRSGAIAADALLQGFGVGAYYLIGSLALLDGWLLARRPVATSSSSARKVPARLPSRT